jgi:hypothetical protein
MVDRFGRRRLVLLLALGGLAATLAYAASGGRAGPDPGGTTLATTDSSTSSTPTVPAIDPAAVAPTDRFVVAPGGSEPVGQGTLRTYTVEVEEGIPFDVAAFAGLVDEILADARGWTATGDVALQHVGPEGAPDLRVRLATPATTDLHCAPLDTHGDLSCRNGADVMINLVRWLDGAPASGMPLAEYRQYVISHEVGHALGHDHVGCPGPGQLAPVMLQQTLGLDGCLPNPWPHP